MHDKTQALEAFKETIKIFNDHLGLNSDFFNKAQLFEKQLLVENFTKLFVFCLHYGMAVLVVVFSMEDNRRKLVDRLHDIEENKRALDEMLTSETEEAQRLMAELSQLKPEVKRLHTQQEEVKLYGFKIIQV